MALRVDQFLKVAADSVEHLELVLTGWDGILLYRAAREVQQRGIVRGDGGSEAATSSRPKQEIEKLAVICIDLAFFFETPARAVRGTRP
jgi:hypothetical protein